MEHTHEMTTGQVQNQGERLPADQKQKYHHFNIGPYLLRQMVILMTALILADYLDPVGYIFTKSEYYGVPVSVKAKFVIVMVIICISTVIGTHYGCHHHYYQWYCNETDRIVVNPVFIQHLWHLAFTCTSSYIFNHWLILKYYIFQLWLYIVFILVYSFVWIFIFYNAPKL